jgi:hypothetical protein
MEKYDVVVALGKNCGLVRKLRIEDSRPTQYTTLAAGILLKRGCTDRIIFSGGRTLGEDEPSEARQMYDFLMRCLPRKDYEHLIQLEEKSIDTYGNACEIKKMIGDKENVGLLSISPHFPRAAETFHNAGIDVYAIYSENVLRGISSELDKHIKEWNLSMQKAWEDFKEAFILRPLSRHPGIIRCATSVLRR